MDLELNGRRALVTGGSRGLGRAIALGLAEEGCDVAICARDSDEVGKALDELSSRGASTFGRAVDVLEADALTEFIDAAASALGGLDVLVACAGGQAGGPRIDAINAEDWRATLDLNVTHPATAVSAAKPWMIESDAAAMLFISSIAGMHPWTRSHYAAAKAAEINLASSLARELAVHGIRVNALSPGSIIFPGSVWEGVQNADPEAFEQWLQAELPLGRLGTDREISDAACFLLSNRASWISGANIVVDGAQNAPNMLSTMPLPGRWRG